MTAIEKDSPTWRALKRRIEVRIDELRAHLEAPLDAEATAMIRGRIAELRELIATVEPRNRTDNEIGAPVY